MKKGDYLTALLKSPKTIFSLQDIALLWQTSNTNTTSVRLHYYVEHGDCTASVVVCMPKANNMINWNWQHEFLPPLM